ncbi:MAG: DJ-1/PfpI family protein [Alphaproteobacteria bacterium]|nr:DJ-1/PfpI family protein [Alphaproteobacteria bacterium]
MAEEKLAIAILAAAGFAETTFTDTQKMLLSRGRQVKVISPDGGLVQGWHDGSWGHHFMADEDIAESLAADFSGLILPDGKNSADTLIDNVHTKRLIAAFMDAEEPVLVVGDAMRLLVPAGVVAARRIAGATEVDEEVARAGAELVTDQNLVTDGNLVTATSDSSSAARLEAFLALIVEREAVPQAA